MRHRFKRAVCLLFHSRVIYASRSSSTLGIPGGTMTDEACNRPHKFCPQCDPLENQPQWVRELDAKANVAFKQFDATAKQLFEKP